MLFEMETQYYLTQTKGGVGRIRFSLREKPAISEISREMRRMLQAEREDKWLYTVMRNPGLLVPADEEKKIADCIDYVQKNEEPALYQGKVLTLRQNTIPVFGMIDKGLQEGEYLALLYDCQAALEKQTDSLLTHYVKVWKNYSEWMTEYDVNANMSRCIYARRTAVPDMWVRMEDSMNLHIERQVAKPDRERVRTFYQHNLRKGNTASDYAEIDFSMLNRYGKTCPYRGVLIGLGNGKFLFCGMPNDVVTNEGRTGSISGRMSQNLRKNNTDHGHIVEITTFGTFSVNVDGVPILFRHEKSRELLAVLIDRRGNYATAQNLITFLWENEPASELTYSRLRKVVMRLKDTLCAYDIGDILESVSGKRRIVPEKVNCDLYNYLNQGSNEQVPYQGNYLPEYSWSEYTYGEFDERRR